MLIILNQVLFSQLKAASRRDITPRATRTDSSFCSLLIWASYSSSQKWACDLYSHSRSGKLRKRESWGEGQWSWKPLGRSCGGLLGGRPTYACACSSTQAGGELAADRGATRAQCGRARSTYWRAALLLTCRPLLLSPHVVALAAGVHLGRHSFRLRADVWRESETRAKKRMKGGAQEEGPGRKRAQEQCRAPTLPSGGARCSWAPVIWARDSGAPVPAAPSGSEGPRHSHARRITEARIFGRIALFLRPPEVRAPVMRESPSGPALLGIGRAAPAGERENSREKAHFFTCLLRSKLSSRPAYRLFSSVHSPDQLTTRRETIH